jgi:ParB family chromosome partitioning protein
VGHDYGETKNAAHIRTESRPTSHRNQWPTSDGITGPHRPEYAIKAEQEKRRREEAIAQVTGLRVLSATSEAVPVRLMKRDLLFVVERLSAILDDRRLAIILRQHNLGKPNGATDAPAKRLSAFLRKADESTLGRRLVELAVLQAAASPNESSKALREAAEFYKVDVGAITAKIKQEFATKDKAKAAKTATPKPTAKGAKKPIAA